MFSIGRSIEDWQNGEIDKSKCFMEMVDQNPF